jgi:SpoVK/Ycf46/Vps4 family AAA+-type ATPase
VPRAYSPILRLWILRLIQLGGGLFAERRSRADLSSEALEAAGLEPMDGRMRHEEPGKLDRLQAAYDQALAKAEAAAIRPPESTVLARNIQWLGEATGLSPAERGILLFTILAFHHPGLENALEQVGGLSISGLQGLLSRVLGLEIRTVAKALDPAGLLARTGLLVVDSSMNYPYRNKVEILDGLTDQMTVRHADQWSLFRCAFVAGRASNLDLAHYPHLAKDLEILAPYLREAFRLRRKCVNVLIYGTPGTGKTELVRALAKHLGVHHYEVASERPNGSPVEGFERFKGFRLAQTILSRRERNLIFFDEIEDVFRPREDGPRSPRTNVSGIKAWVNKTLEENPVPAFWVSNHIGILDDAFIRRFDYVIRLDNPPRSVRRRMLEDNLAGLPVEGSRKDQLADHQGLSPAIITRAARVARTTLSGSQGGDAGAAFTQVLGNTLEALGHSRTSRQAVEVVTDYRPELVNTDCDLGPVLWGLREHGNGRLCFYGPPGTGKTAYGRHLAEQLDRPLLVKRASDLLSMWVGGTEKNLATMFEEAQTEGAVLLLDEADSFLQERSSAQRNFEVTQVNEMLTQMEGFNGIFIASTNLMDRLDTAAMRRFDMKVRFDYLRADQAWAMFQDAARRLGIDPDPAVRGSLSSLGMLTPGDFATVLRQARLNRPSSAEELVGRLEAECQVKPEHRRKPIGFMGRAS